MSDTTCNGWSNYATWRVNLELLDEYCSFLNGNGNKFETVEHLADHLKEYTEGYISESFADDSPLVEGWANAFVEDVNWREIAGHWESENLIMPEEDEAADFEGEI